MPRALLPWSVLLGPLGAGLGRRGQGGHQRAQQPLAGLKLENNNDNNNNNNDNNKNSNSNNDNSNTSNNNKKKNI